MKLHGNRTAMPRLEEFAIGKVADRAAVAAARSAVRDLRIADEVVEYIVDLVRATRDHPSILHGGSPRSANMIASASRALAALRGRDFVLPDDVKELYLPTMRRKLSCSLPRLRWRVCRAKEF
ncbi:MAG: hypothetical protein R3E12_11350 [Candidatus Eisenbacteria bacterium]